MSPPSILLLEDDESVRLAVSRLLTSEGFQVLEARTLAEARNFLSRASLDLALADYCLPDGTGLDLVRYLRARVEPVPVILFTGFGTIDLAVKALKEGAEHFLTKPVELPALLILIRKAIHKRDLAAQRNGTPDLEATRNPFLGSGKLIEEVAFQAHRMKDSDQPLLLLGESGSGKGVLARWIHHHGRRSQCAFMDINCAGLSRDLLESELLGHEKGAFTGATLPKKGLFELCDGGTLFLDEVGDMEVPVQPKLLKVLEERRFRRLGGIQDLKTDFRLVAATHQDLESLVAARRFREDLFYRISALPLRIPPLRERPEDIPMIAAAILQEIAGRLGCREARLTPEAQSCLQDYAWPGNIREMRNHLERSLLFSETGEIRPEDLKLQAALGPMGGPLDEVLRRTEKAYIARVLLETGNHAAEAARRLGMSRSTFYEKIKTYGLVPAKG